MNRQQRRAKGIKNKNEAVYTLTKEQLDTLLAETYAKAMNEALIIMFSLPCKVLMDHFWQKSYHTRLKCFANLLADYYEMWQNDEIKIEDLRKDLWEYGGIGFEKCDK